MVDKERERYTTQVLSKELIEPGDHPDDTEHQINELLYT